MSEEIRSIEVTIKVNTSKRTFVQGFDADDLGDALEKFRADIDDIRWSL